MDDKPTLTPMELGLIAIASAKFAKESEHPIAEAVKKILLEKLECFEIVDQKIIRKTLAE